MRQQTKFIGSLGQLNLTLGVLTRGKGKPHVLIINNLHGNELTGFYVLERLRQSSLAFNGKLTIITSANPLGLIHKTRFLPLDWTDLNRGYPPAFKERGLGNFIKDQLIKLALSADLVIDLHCFLRPCLSAALSLNQANDNNKKLINKLLKVANTDIAIKLNGRLKEEQRLEKSLDYFLVSQGRPVLVIEYPPANFVSREQIERYAQGLNNVLAVYGGLKQPAGQLKKIEYFYRQQILADDSGIFEPQDLLGKTVKAGERLGFLISVKNLQRQAFYSPYAGKVVELAGRSFVLLGEKLATIGKAVNLLKNSSLPTKIGGKSSAVS